MPIFKYQPVVTHGPNGTTLRFRRGDDSKSVELAEIDGVVYVFVPDGEIVPDQHPGILFSEATVSNDLRETIKANSRACQLIDMAMQDKIRERYSAEDEMYFSRIGTGKALGMYEFQSGEQEALIAYGQYVESVRQWGREQRRAIGL